MEKNVASFVLECLAEGGGAGSVVGLLQVLPAAGGPGVILRVDIPVGESGVVLLSDVLGGLSELFGLFVDDIGAGSEFVVLDVLEDECGGCEYYPGGIEAPL